MSAGNHARSIEDDTVTTSKRVNRSAKLRAAWEWCQEQAAREPEFALRHHMEDAERLGFGPRTLTALRDRGFLVEVTDRRSRQYVFYHINPDHPPESELDE